MHLPRSSGVLCHVTSLPGAFGIGDFGPSAFQFVDSLREAEQCIWQILPLGPPAEGNSPYSAYSAFAGNPLLISLQGLVECGLLDESDLVVDSSSFDETCSQVDYEKVASFKRPRLRKAFSTLRQKGNATLEKALQAFVDKNAWWLDEFARFESLMHQFDERDWTTWPIELVQRQEQAMTRWDAELAEEIRFATFQQFVFDAQWQRLKRYANERNIRVYGDMPIFVAHESADVWANQSLFHLDAAGRPLVVAGVPPDYFSKTGQLWGNPLYRWDVLKASDYAWWTARFAHAFEQFDLLRIDHFRGFEAYWEIPATAATAIDGNWRQGPGEKPFHAAAKKLGELALIAEDLGMITEQVHQLRDKLGFPGMRVLQFGFDQQDDDYHRPSAYPKHAVAYTGTHDNDTVMGWYRSRDVSPDDDDLLAEVVTSDENVHLQLIAAVLGSASDTAVIPIQDWLGLGSEARMNQPGQSRGSWAWRLQPGFFTQPLVATMASMTKAADR